MERGLTVKEKDIQKQILEYLSYRHIFCWRNNSGAFKYEGKSKMNYVRYGLKGSSDILGIMPDGRFLAIEVKNDKGKLSEAQEIFLKVIKDNKGVAFVAHSVEEVIKELDKVKIYTHIDWGN